MPEPTGFIPFNKPFTIGRELEFISMAVKSGHISANGFFTEKCIDFFTEKYKLKKCFLTSSCTDALEMAALLLEIHQGDEVIIPSYSFVSTANPFVLRGAKIIFADSCFDHPNIDAEQVESLITSKTKAIVCVHYAGMACNLEKLVSICKKYNVALVEDAAHAIESLWFPAGKESGKQLGSIGTLGTFSFHETKNISSGEGGLLCVNDENYIARAEIISEKGTNRSSFFRNEVNKYEWMDVGSSFLASELAAAFLYGQLECLDKIQKRRLENWNDYHTQLEALEKESLVQRPQIPSWAMTNGHIYYLVCRSAKERSELIALLKKNNIQSVFHYQSLHKSPFYRNFSNGINLPNADRFSDCLVRLPLYYELSSEEISRICSVIRSFYGFTF